jgi:hypothetical protein
VLACSIEITIYFVCNCKLLVSEDPQKRCCLLMIRYPVMHLLFSSVGDQRLLKIQGSFLQCAVQTHRLLLKVANLIPENCFVGQQENVPGIVVTKGKDNGEPDLTFLP